MKKHYLFTLFMSFICLSAFAQGTEDFTNATIPAAYGDGSFIGNDGIEWTYTHSRNEATFPIDGNGIMLRRADEPSSLSATITGGLGNFSVDTRKAYTGNNQRRIELVINGIVIEQFTPAYAEGEDVTVFPFEVTDINVEGEVTIILRLYGAIGNQQMTLDNLSWTGYTGGGTGGCAALAITSTTPGDVCEEGTVTLEATAASEEIYWFDQAVDGEIVNIGGTFVTPVLTETTSYWVSEVLLDAGSLNPGQAKVTTNASPSGTAPGASGWGLIFEATNLFTINDVEVFLSSATAGDLTINLTDMSFNVLETATFAVPAGSSSSPVSFIAALNFDIAPGTYRLVAAQGSPAMIRDFSPAFPYAIGNSGNVNTGALGTGTNNAYYYFYNWTITEPQVQCESDRIEVIATVNEIITVDVTASETEICEGDSTDLSVTSTNTDYEYVWEPGALVGADQTVSPTETTTYTVTATDTVTGCETEESITIIVNVVPTELVVNPATETVCMDSVIALTAGAAGVATIEEDFEGATNSWTIIDNSSNANGTWSLAQSPFQTSIGGSAGLLSSNDASQFYVSDSNGLGSGGTIDSQLISPSFSLEGSTDASVTFYHYYRLGSTSSTSTFYTEARVEVSVDGGNTFTLVEQYDTVNQGTPTAFAEATLSLNDYLGESDVRVRFHYDGGWGYVWAIDNVSFDGAVSGDVVWSPSTGLFSDAEATIPYDGSATGFPVYFEATTDGEVTYTATLTIGTCGSVSGDAVITVTEAANAPVGDEEQFFDAGETLADLMVTGENLTWYADEDGTMEITDTTLLVDGTTYYVSQTIGGCESELLAITVTQTLGVQDATFSNVSLYPNPTSSVLHIANTSVIDTVEIYSLLGQKVMAHQGGATSIQLDLSGLASGAYLAKITIDGATKIVKVIKK